GFGEEPVVLAASLHPKPSPIAPSTINTVRILIICMGSILIDPVWNENAFCGRTAASIVTVQAAVLK
ncbi:MAG TPA: hypothetical protein P5055_02580, partial [Candidatus Paceibacterota bacterium]|nr:hypothetical protein [Candidatus Paceibacterota bacterium]